MSRQNWKPGNMLYPLPVVMVTCRQEGMRPNIITIGWAGTICSDPAMVSISVRKERFSYDMIKNSGEFVINLVTKDLVYATDYCGVKSGRDVDKFKECNLTPIDSKVIKTPQIAESPVCIECKVENIVELGTHDMFIARVVNISVDEKYMDDTGKFNLNDADLIAYSHGEYYTLGEYVGKFGYSVKK